MNITEQLCILEDMIEKNNNRPTALTKWERVLNNFITELENYCNKKDKVNNVNKVNKADIVTYNRLEHLGYIYDLYYIAVCKIHDYNDRLKDNSVKIRLYKNENIIRIEKLACLMLDGIDDSNFIY